MCLIRLVRVQAQLQIVQAQQAAAGQQGVAAGAVVQGTPQDAAQHQQQQLQQAPQRTTRPASPTATAPAARPSEKPVVRAWPLVANFDTS